MGRVRAGVPDAQRMRDALEALPSVRRAVVDGPPWTVYLVCDAPDTSAPVEASAAVVLGDLGLAPAEVALHTSFLVRPEPRRRVRLVGVTLRRPRTGAAAAEVELEWLGDTVTGAVEGEGGPGGDLRVCAAAALRAIRSLVPAAPALQLVGIKSIRVFDQDLVVVLIKAGSAGEQSLVGATLAADDTARSVAAAVLNAMNRLLGNYLSVPD